MNVVIIAAMTEASTFTMSDDVGQTTVVMPSKQGLALEGLGLLVQVKDLIKDLIDMIDKSFLKLGSRIDVLEVGYQGVLDELDAIMGYGPRARTQTTRGGVDTKRVVRPYVPVVEQPT